MRQLSSLPILTLTISSLSVIAAAPSYASTMFQSTLTGSQQVPIPVTTTGTGAATLQLTGGPGSWVLNYSLTYSGLTSPIAAPYAHIHNAPFGANGPVVHDLDGANVPPIEGSQSGTIIGDWAFNDAVKPLTDALAMELMQGNLYFNIHTTNFPGGEIRGQIAAVPEPSEIMGVGLAATIGFMFKFYRSKKR